MQSTRLAVDALETLDSEHAADVRIALGRLEKLLAPAVNHFLRSAFSASSAGSVGLIPRYI